MSIPTRAAGPILTLRIVTGRSHTLNLEAVSTRAVRTFTAELLTKILAVLRRDRSPELGDAMFDNAQFVGDARFDGAHFTGNARFVEAHFAATPASVLHSAKHGSTGTERNSPATPASSKRTSPATPASSKRSSPRRQLRRSAVRRQRQLRYSIPRSTVQRKRQVRPCPILPRCFVPEGSVLGRCQVYGYSIRWRREARGSVPESGTRTWSCPSRGQARTRRTTVTQHLVVEAFARRFTCIGTKFDQGATIRLRWADVVLDSCMFGQPPRPSPSPSCRSAGVEEGLPRRVGSRPYCSPRTRRPSNERNNAPRRNDGHAEAAVDKGRGCL